MINTEQVKEFLKQSDISDEIVAMAIERANRRFEILTNTQPDPANPEHKQAILYLTVLEIAPHANLYYRGQNNTELIRTKELVAEVERLLNLSPKGAVVWQTI